MTDPTLDQRFDAAFAALPLVAILRGLPPADAEPAAAVLYEAGFRLIEVPLNSPEPFDSIDTIRRTLPRDALVGAGTVLAPTQVDRLAAIGAELVVMPHADTAIVGAAKARSMICIPGIATATEAFAALAAGADALKLFPAEQIAPPVVKALRAVIPHHVRLLPVGGIGPDSMAPYRAAGAAGFGLGSALYSPGLPAAELAARARQFVRAWSGSASP